eukprot:850777-Prymnesium_polylepis.1
MPLARHARISEEYSVQNRARALQVQRQISSALRFSNRKTYGLRLTLDSQDRLKNTSVAHRQPNWGPQTGRSRRGTLARVQRAHAGHTYHMPDTDMTVDTRVDAARNASRQKRGRPRPVQGAQCKCTVTTSVQVCLSLIHISEPTRRS